MKMRPIVLALKIGRDQNGQVLPWSILLMIIFLGIAALVVDVGRGLVAYQEITASTNAAALAAGYTLPASNYSCEGLLFSASSNSNSAGTSTNYCGSGASSVYTGANRYPMLNNVTTTVTPKCSSTIAGSGWNIPCQTIGSGSTTANVVTVHQSAQVPTFFAGLIGVHNLTVAATAAAAARGAGAQSWNIAVVLDTTGSMSSSDNGCGTVPGVSGTPSRLQCALYGVQVLLNNLNPCPTSFSSCSSTAQTSERVSLWTFPNMVTTTVVNDTNCSSANPTTQPYTFPSSSPSASNFSNGTYITGGKTYSITYAVSTTDSTGATPSYLTDYRTSDTSSSLTTSSALSKAIGAGGSSCSSVTNPGGESTYYAGALYAAQASLLKQQATLKAAGQTSQNAIILLSDGDAEAGKSNMVNASTQTCSTCLVATSNGTYPSWVDECGQAIQAAQSISGQGTRVYTIAYGAESSGCNTDTSGSYANITPCTAMRDMSSSHWANPSSDQFFYADTNQSGSGIDKTCASAANSSTNLQSIFLAIGNDLQNARLIPLSLAN